MNQKAKRGMKHKHNFNYWKLSGEIVRLTQEGLEVTKTPPRGPICLGCGKTEQEIERILYDGK